jgi:hypothetical protein
MFLLSSQNRSQAPQGRVESPLDPVSHQCPKTRSDTLDEATQMRHGKRPNHYLCDTVEQLFTHLSSLGVKWSQVQILAAVTLSCPETSLTDVSGHRLCGQLIFG